MMSNLITDVGYRFHLHRLFRQLVSRLSQMASKVSQVCRREDLDWVRTWVLQFLENGQVGSSVILENVPKNGGQLVDLTWCRSGFGVDQQRVRLIHIGSRHFILAFFNLVPAVRLLRVVLPDFCLVHFRNLEGPTPVIGKLGSLFPRVYPSTVIGSDVTYDPVEEELRLSIAMVSLSIHFRYHEATKSWLGRIGIGYCDLRKVMCMELATLFCHLSLEWKGFFLSWSDRRLMITGSRKGYCWSFG